MALTPQTLAPMNSRLDSNHRGKAVTDIYISLVAGTKQSSRPRLDPGRGEIKRAGSHLVAGALRKLAAMLLLS